MTSSNQMTILDSTFDRDDTEVMFGMEPRVRRALNFTAAAIGLVLFVPILLVTAIAIKLDSRGPIFIREPKFGHGNRMIQLLEFRFPSAREDGHTPACLTRVGRVLFETGIDQLPQIFNVLRGELSIIGPSPRPCPTPLLNEVKPGMDPVGSDCRYEETVTIGNSLETCRIRLRWLLAGREMRIRVA
jgi:lipopolysaccharide/colanic/teichoic acid biosynthesis glycosyltransferase